MPVIPKPMRKVNAFKDVKVLTNKDIYDKVGERMPSMPATGCKAIFGLSKVNAISAGEDLVTRAFHEHETSLQKQAEAAAELANQRSAEPAPAEPAQS